ncbi:hypothetical protein AB205_0004460 [Aquarana catesbeiana]|uniref:G-protein coupled receptors family 1 profile domain-containing protein n=1 Tax=Aquarana catesbeiana TaxID=8400 RepID=A0A2G9Q5Z1_AQUCT|nr:hypothetical protein AB205_0004460 [Aquarana catesbeiana]
MRNLTKVTSLTLVGLSDHPQTMNGLFVLFLLIYLMTLITNLLIFFLVLTDYHLHNPMYFFLANLAFLDITVLTIRSKTGKRKAFSTCTSHLTVVFIFYGAFIFIYFVPSSSNMFNSNKLFTVISALINPLLNPLIYSLRNKDLMEALMRSYYHLKLIPISF